MNCFSNTDAIKIFKGDDTDFCGKNFITFRFVSDLDLSSFTGVFKLGEYKQVQNIFNNEMVVNIPHEATSKYQVGTMSGIFRLIDNSGKIATVTNSIPFQITQKPFTQEHSVVELEVPESYPVTINLEIGIQNGDYSILQHKPSINSVTLVGNKTSEDLGLATSSDVQTVQENLNTHIENLSNPHEVTKSQVGLGNVDNTADLDKPISTATQAALNTKVEDVLLNGNSIVTNKVASFTLGTMAQESKSDYSTKAVADTLYADISYESTIDNHISNTSNPHSVTKSQVGLGNVDNTSDTNKPISTATQAALDGKQATLSTAQLDAVNSGIDSTKVAQISTNTGNISTIEGKIPTQASTTNQLADKDFVNSSISTNTANFIGTFESVSDLEAYSGTVTNNDYAFVVNSVVKDNGNDWATFSDLDAYDKSLLTEFDYAWVINVNKFDLYRFDILTQTWSLRVSDTKKEDVTLNTAYNRYKSTVSGSTVTWSYEYTLNNSSFTASQWASINSGITSSLVTQIGTNTTAISGKQDTLVSGTNIKTVNNTSLLGSGDITIDSLPSQTGQSGKFLTTDGSSASWGSAPSSLPSQTGNNGKFLTTNGTDASWAAVDTLPSQTGQSGKYLTTNGTSASWGNISALKNTATGADAITILGNASGWADAVNIGVSTAVGGDGGVAIGYRATVGGGGVSIGRTANRDSNGYRSIAIGEESSSTATESIAIGCGSVSAQYAIQLGRGSNSTASTLQVYSYQLLNSSGKIPSARLPVATTSNVGGVKVDGSTITINNGVISAAGGGGSSAPTLTWYKDNTGTTVTISDTSSANLVKVYKNGILLEPTEDYSISGTTLTMVTALVATDKIAVEVF